MSPTASRASALRLSFLLLWRDLLARELNLLLVALLVAVAAVTTVGFFVDRLDRALNEQALHLLGGDLVLRADRPIPEDWTRKARALGLRVAHTASFPSMAMAESSTPAADAEDEDEALPPTQLASVLAVHNDIIPPTINHDEDDVDENIDYNLNFTFNKAQKRVVRAALSNTFGFGGHNACVIFKKYAE